LHLTVSSLLMVLVTALASAQHGPMVLTDFSAASDLGWYVVNDGVMGGRSQGGFEVDGGTLVFAGVTNTDGGGFSSIRSRERLSGLDGYGAVVLHARGDGRRYVLRLENEDGVAYWADFEPAEGDWGEVRVPFERFYPRFRGRRLDGPPLDPARIVSLGILCYDGRDGPFRLEVDRIEAR